LKLIKALTLALWTFAFGLAALAADTPAPKEGDWVVRDFRFHTGEVLPELRLHYTTVGAPTGEPVLILHGLLDDVVPLRFYLHRVADLIYHGIVLTASWFARVRGIELGDPVPLLFYGTIVALILASPFIPRKRSG